MSHEFLDWNGVLIPGTLDGAGAHAYALFSGTVVGTGSDVLTVHSRNDPSWNQFDDIDVVGHVPEPATYSLLGLGLLAAPLALKLRRKKA